MKTFAFKENKSCSCRPIGTNSGSLSYRPIKIRFRFKGVIGGNCDNGDSCGGCPGICVAIPIGSYHYREGLNNELADDGWGIALVAEDNDLLHLIPLATIDNGDGYVRITENFKLPSMSVDNSTKETWIRKGKYKLQYNPEYPFGYLLMNII